MGGATPCSAHDAHFTTPTGGARKRAATRAEHRWIVNEPACKPDPVPLREGRATTIHLGTPSPGTSSGPPANSGEQPFRASLHVIRAAAPTGGAAFDLAPGGVYPATPVTRGAGALLPHRFTLTSLESVAVCFLWHLSRGSPRVAVSNHPALWSPDFPREAGLSPGGDGSRPAAVRPARSHASLVRQWPWISGEMRGVVDQVHGGRPVRVEAHVGN